MYEVASTGADLSDANLSSEMVINVKGVKAETIETAIGVLYAYERSGPSGIRITGVGHPLIDQKKFQMNPDELGATFASGANLSGANLSRATLVRANLRGADLIGANLSGAKLSGANLSSAEISQDSLETLFETKFKSTNLEEANLTGAILIEANLNGANLDRADLSGANLGGANLSEANLEGANLSDADLGEARAVTGIKVAKLPGTNVLGPSYQLGYIKANLSGANVTAEQL